MAAATCKTCEAPNRDEIEALGLKAVSGEISWREAARDSGLARYQSLQNHMDKHYVDNVAREAESEFDTLVIEGVAELRQAMRTAPAEVKPLYAVAIMNLKGLAETKPSQQHLIQSLKTIQEMTGMRQEQRLMLTFIDSMFAKPPAVSEPARPILVQNLSESAAMAPPAPPMPTGTAPTPGDESAMAAAMAAGPQAGPAQHAAMTKPAHNISGSAKHTKQQNAMPAYGPASQ
jgi:hypothetical protein